MSLTAKPIVTNKGAVSMIPTDVPLSSHRRPTSPTVSAVKMLRRPEGTIAGKQTRRPLS